MTSRALPVFSDAEYIEACNLLAARVATMQGRKMEEADWDFVYCNARQIPQTNWSNLHIDINYCGLGVEHKMLRVTGSGDIRNECGTTRMHPAGTRSIRIPAVSDPDAAARNILEQYCALIEIRTQAVMDASPDGLADMRIGWLLWKESLEEFLYFEERMEKPDPRQFYAEWNITL